MSVHTIFNVDNDEPPRRRWTRSKNLPTVPGAGDMSLAQIRERFKIPNSVEISKLGNLFDPINEDEAAISFYQLEHGLSLPVDVTTCTLLHWWGIPFAQIHPALFIALRRLYTITTVFNISFSAKDAFRIVSPSLRHVNKTSKHICFSYNWLVRKRCLTDFPTKFGEWTKPSFRVRNWRDKHQISVPHKLVVDDHRRVSLRSNPEAEDKLEALFGLHENLFDVSYPESYVRWFYDHNYALGCAPVAAVPLTQLSFHSSHNIPTFRHDINDAGSCDYADQMGDCSGSSAYNEASSASCSLSTSSAPLRFTRKKRLPQHSCPNMHTNLVDQTNVPPVHRRLRRGPPGKVIRNVDNNISDAISKKPSEAVRRSERNRKPVNYAETSFSTPHSSVFMTPRNFGMNRADESLDSEVNIYQSASDSAAPSSVLVAGANISRREHVMGTEFTDVSTENLPSRDAMPFPKDDAFPTGNEGNNKNGSGLHPKGGKSPRNVTREEDQSVPKFLNVPDPSDSTAYWFDEHEYKRNSTSEYDSCPFNISACAERLYDELGPFILLLNETKAAKEAQRATEAKEAIEPDREKELMSRISDLEADNMVLTSKVEELTQEVATVRGELGQSRKRLKSLFQQWIDGPDAPPS